MVLTLHQISTEKEPLRSWFEREYRNETGHPDYPYTHIAWKKLKSKEEKELKKQWEVLDKLKEEPKTYRTIEKEFHKPRLKPISINIKFPRLGNLLTKSVLWYLVYFFLLVFFSFIFQVMKRDYIFS